MAKCQFVTHYIDNRNISSIQIAPQPIFYLIHKVFRQNLNKQS